MAGDTSSQDKDGQRARSDGIRSHEGGVRLSRDAKSGVTSESEGSRTATPDEVLAETEAEDPDVGIDGTGVGGLP